MTSESHLSTRGRIWLLTHNFYWWQKIYDSKTSDQMKLTYNDSKFPLFCGIKATEDMHQIPSTQALHWTGSSSFMFASFLTDSLLFLSLPSCCRAFGTSVNIDFIYFIDIAHTETGTLHKQWCNGLETPHDQQQRGKERSTLSLLLSSFRASPLGGEA